MSTRISRIIYTLINLGQFLSQWRWKAASVCGSRVVSQASCCLIDDAAERWWRNSVMKTISDSVHRLWATQLGYYSLHVVWPTPLTRRHRLIARSVSGEWCHRRKLLKLLWECHRRKVLKLLRECHRRKLLTLLWECHRRKVLKLLKECHRRKLSFKTAQRVPSKEAFNTAQRVPSKEAFKAALRMPPKEAFNLKLL